MLNRRLFMTAIAGLGLVPKPSPVPPAAAEKLRGIVEQMPPSDEIHFDQFIDEVMGSISDVRPVFEEMRSWSTVFKRHVYHRRQRERYEAERKLRDNEVAVRHLAAQFGIKLQPPRPIEPPF